MAFIGFGTFSKYYTYIIILVVFRFICDYLEGFNLKYYYKKPTSETFGDFASILAYHPLFRDFFYFFGSLMCGLVLYIIYHRNEKENQDNKLTITEVEKIKASLLGIKDESSNLRIFIISFIYGVNILHRTFLMSMKFDAGFWTLEILFVIFLTIRILKVKIGNHQKVTIFILAFFLFFIQKIISLLPQTKHKCSPEENCKDKYITDNNIYVFITKKFGGIGFIFLILFLYIFDFMMRDYSWVKFKYLMDAKSVPVFKIMTFIGITGCCIVIIILSIVTNVPCNIIDNVTKNDNIYYKEGEGEIDFSKQVCGIIDYEERTKKLFFYYDNFYFFNYDFHNSLREALEIFVSFLYFINNFFINFSQSMILKHLDPNAMLVNVNFNYFFLRMITYIKNDASEEFMTVAQFILLEFCEIFAIIAYMIYIELIELKFCHLDYDLKNSIGLRGIQESLQNNLSNIDIDPEDNEAKRTQTSKSLKENLIKTNFEKNVEMIDKYESN